MKLATCSFDFQALNKSNHKKQKNDYAYAKPLLANAGISITSNSCKFSIIVEIHAL
jgi:hypothetical protein|tara:strand:+ start:48 stop:215 length:168 start_codon:yes stop_codon:yes gene_type:complete